MTINIKDLTLKERSTKATLTVGDGENRRAVDITLYFGSLTPRLWQEMNQIEDKPKEKEEEISGNKTVLVRQLVLIKTRSDEIVDDAGTSVELTADYLDTFDVFNLKAMMEAIMRESLPKQVSLPPTEDTSSKENPVSAEAISQTG